MGIPTEWDQQAHAEWTAGRQSVALQMLLPQLNKPNALPALPLQAAYYLFLDGAYESARKILLKAVEAHPDDLLVLLNLAVMQTRTGHDTEARQLLEHYIELGGAEAAAYDGLCMACHRVGDDEAARRWGEKAIRAKTVNASKSAPELPLGKPRKTGHDIISFSLWGNHPRYLRGALHNSSRAPSVYPGFQCRFYADRSVPEDVLAALRGEGAQLLIEETDQPVRERLTRRFLVADDPAVARYLVRDCDSVISEREAAAVAIWIDSGKAFHVMRDWWTHTDPILAGMWGGRGGVLPSLQPLIHSYRSSKVETPNWDQWFLRDCIWPGIRNACLVHDRLFVTEGAQPFPAQTPTGNLHVGQNEFAARKEQQARELERFKASVPSLQL